MLSVFFEKRVNLIFSTFLNYQCGLMPGAKGN